MKQPITQIRSTGFTKVNQLVRAARHLKELQPAFAQWSDGEIYVCKKTGSYRYRFGAQSKSPTPWSKLAESLFPTPAAFAFAAMMLAPEHRTEAITKPAGEAPKQIERVNVIQLAKAA